jgi:putative ABC transport system substrate-binding protein
MRQDDSLDGIGGVSDWHARQLGPVTIKAVLSALALLGVIVGQLPSSAFAQSLARPPLIAMLITGTPAATEAIRSSFRSGLSDLGYTENRHYVVDERFAEGIIPRLPRLAEEIVQRRPAVILTSSTASTLAVRNATSDIPIVSALMGNAVGAGLIESQARPGGNVTGIVVTDADLAAKHLALALELVPSARRIGVLANTSNPGTLVQRQGAETAGMALSIPLVFAEAQTSEAIERAFEELARSDVGAVFVIADSLFFSERERVASAALATRLPTVFGWRENVQAGGLMSYGVNLNENYRRAASYVDKILKGAKPADLPVEQPTRYELSLNLTTAKAIGLTVPSTVLVRANEIIE